MQKNHAVWVWREMNEAPRYVGYGKFDDYHPAIIAFNHYRGGDSELGIWLAGYENEPLRENYGPKLVSRFTAMQAVIGLRSRHSATLFKSRGPSSYSGGHPSRQILYFDEADCERSKVYESIREASRDIGVNASTITRWCKSDTNVVWSYLDVLES